MRIEIELTEKPISPRSSRSGDNVGAVVEFTGIVRGEENGVKISAIQYEAYYNMAKQMMEKIAQKLGEKYQCESVVVVHRVGIITAGEPAIYIRVESKHRAEAFGMVIEFLEQLKKDTPIWKSKIIKNPDFKNERTVHTS